MKAEVNPKIYAPLVSISQIAPSTESLPDITEKLRIESLQELRDHPLETPKIDRKFQGKESILSSHISLYVEQTKTKIPDGGWGWMVILAAFTINMISEGVILTFGLLYIEFLNEFGASKSATSWIGSLFMAVPLITGPIGSALVDRYGCKYMTILGALICTVGFIISVFAKTIGVLYITFGVIGGIGRALCYVTAVVSIAFWFEKKRTVALGLAASGAGFGTVVFSPLSSFLLSEYRWRGTLLIFAGFFANMCVCGVLMRDPDWIILEEKKTKKVAAQIKKENYKVVHAEKNGPRYDEDSYNLLYMTASMELSDKPKFSSVINLPTFLKENEKVPIEVLRQLSRNKQLYGIVTRKYPHLVTCRGNGERGVQASPCDECTTFSRVPLKIVEEQDAADENDNNKNGSTHHKDASFFRSITSFPVSKSKSMSHSYLKNLRFRRNSIGSKGVMLNIHKYKITASSCPNVYRNTTIPYEEEEKWYKEFLDILKDLTHFSLFLELHFLLLALSTIILFIWFIVPYFYLAEHMSRCGYDDSQASFVLSAIGFTTTIGMIFLGWAGDRLNVTKTYAVCLILCGISVGCIMFFSNNYTLLVISCSLFGLFFASCFSLCPSLLAQLVPLEEFTMAYGLLLLCEGIGNLIGPPLAGLLFDLTQTWDQSFYQAAFWIIISGILIGFIPYTENRKLFGSKPT